MCSIEEKYVGGCREIRQAMEVTHQGIDTLGKGLEDIEERGRR